MHCTNHNYTIQYITQNTIYNTIYNTASGVPEVLLSQIIVSSLFCFTHFRMSGTCSLVYVADMDDCTVNRYYIIMIDWLISEYWLLYHPIPSHLHVIRLNWVMIIFAPLNCPCILEKIPVSCFRPIFIFTPSKTRKRYE